MELSVKRDGNFQIYYQSSIIWLGILNFTVVPELSNYHVGTKWAYQQGGNNMVIQVVNKVVQSDTRFLYILLWLLLYCRLVLQRIWLHSVLSYPVQNFFF